MTEHEKATVVSGRVAVFLEGFSRKAKEGLQLEAKTMPASLARYFIGILAGLSAEERKLAYGEGQAAISRFVASGMDRDAAQEAAMGFAIEGEESGQEAVEAESASSPEVEPEEDDAVGVEAAG